MFKAPSAAGLMAQPIGFVNQPSIPAAMDAA